MKWMKYWPPSGEGEGNTSKGLSEWSKKRAKSLERNDKVS